MPRDGQLDYAFTYSTEQFERFYDENGNSTARQLDARSYNLFLEWGMDKKTALVVTAPFINNGPDNKAWQDGSLWLKYRNERTQKVNGTNNLLTAIGLSFPLSRYANDNPLAIGRRATVFHGRFVYQYQAEYGWFIQVQSGLDFQFAPVAAGAVPMLLRGGFGTKRYYFDLWLERYQSLNSANQATALVTGPGSSWTRTGGTLYIPIQPWLGVFTGGAVVLGGRNIGASARLNLGLVLRYQR